MDLSADEKEIYDYLKSYSKQYISAIEVCRRAGGKRRFQEDPNWALRILPRMIEKGAVETDSLGHYRIRDEEEEEEEEAKPKKKNKRWVAPHIERILKQSGKKFDGID